ncbi:hypothetical protein CERSUDRAFT_100854 [Gelatoporia subvermispora B]|uniref:Uncharacterized protein n=1 Tax=Ceriporiopsis subvermispora (strain B) TaxID=914234 RepID=M2Q2C7_CERS8|nr:hypothetical protein CERSUDRAFT_100854 [Gelatoporia subvermispora B]
MHFFRLLGKLPIAVTSMAPFTARAGFVRAVLDAGCIVKLVGGGHYNGTALRAKITEIQAKIPACAGITLLSLCTNFDQSSFQVPFWQEMRRECFPMWGFCVAAGIPPIEKTAGITEGPRNIGIKHISFAPGSVYDIRQVASAAAANADFPMITQ